MSELFDEIAKTLARPMPRRRAVGLFAGAIGTAAVALLRPGRGRASAITCPPGVPPCGSAGGAAFCCDATTGEICCPGTSAGTGVCCDATAGESCCTDGAGNGFCCPFGSACLNPGTNYPCNPPCGPG